MSRVRIFVEGIADVRFLEDYIAYCIPADKGQKVELIDMEGKDGLLQNPADQSFPFRQNTDAGGVNLVIFDADDSHQTRADELRKAAATAGIQFEFFLFPNNQQSGDLEALLCELVPADKRVILDCHDAFLTCLRGYPHLSLHLPLPKSKVYAYLDALLTKKEKNKDLAKEGQRNYLIQKHWNLDADYLEPLRAFLTHHLLGAS
jgi:predicted ATP-dependent endonuclease of OLD family